MVDGFVVPTQLSCAVTTRTTETREEKGKSLQLHNGVKAGTCMALQAGPSNGFLEHRFPFEFSQIVRDI